MSLYCEVMSHITEPLVYIWWATVARFAKAKGRQKSTAAFIMAFQHIHVWWPKNATVLALFAGDLPALEIYRFKYRYI